MARARNIKPGFFTNDTLAEVPALGRLLFQGLWCHADREGRLHDRPRKIKAEILPYDDCDVDALLNALQQHGFILRYTTPEGRFIQVVNFSKHQNPHVKEPASEIPAPDEHQTSTVQEQCENETRTEVTVLIPDSGFLIPDKTTEAIASVVASKPATPECPHVEIIALYHELLPAAPQVREWTPARATALKTRWREKPARQSLSWWRKFFGYVAESEFLTGRGGSSPGRDPFVADLEWLIAPRNFVKVIEGKYHPERVTA